MFFGKSTRLSFASLGVRLFDVQKRPGVALHQGRVVEMQTGEGKTLAAVAPACLNALTGKGVPRDEVPILALSGQTPLVEFCRIAQGSFAALPARIDDEIVRTFDALTLTEQGVDGSSVRSPSATWTYLVTDEAYGTNALLGLANKPAIGALGVVALGPILFMWALYQHWTRFKRRRQRASR